MNQPERTGQRPIGPKTLGQIAKLERLWRDVSPTRRASNRPFERFEDESWLVWKDGLSPKLRLHLIMHCFEPYKPRFAGEVLERCLSERQMRHYPNDSHRDTIAAAFETRFGSGKTWTAAEIFESKFWEPDAVESFVAFVTRREVGRELLPKGIPDLWPKGDGHAARDPRSAAVERIKQFIRSEDRSPVFVAHQQGMLTGLTSLAAHLAEFVRSDPVLSDRRLFYLPLSGTGPRVTMPLLAARIHDFYRGLAAVDTVPPTSARALQEMVGSIRERMSRDPAIMIFDGYRAHGRGLPHLRSAMVDDPLLPLLEQIVHPFLGQSGDLPDAEAFLRNRIVVLSDRADDGLAAFGAEQIAVPYSNPTEGMLRHFRAPNQAGKSAELKSALEVRPNCMSDVAIGIALRLLAAGVPEPDLPDSLAGLFKLYADRLTRERPLCSTLLHLIALSDDGLRRETLSGLLDRLFRCLPGCPGPDAPWHPPGDNSEERCDEALRLLVEDGVLIKISDDLMPGVDRQHHLPVEPILYDTVCNELRNHLQSRLAMADHAERLRLAHRLIAEEALRQYTQRLRQPDWLDRFDPRYFRRLWQFFFHAYLSLGGGPSGEVAGIGAVPHVLPARNEEAYRRLYAVFFRGLLEGPPTWELSRVLGRDGLKADILLLAMRAGDDACQDAVLQRDRPWSLQRTGPFMQPGGWEGSRTGPREIRDMGRDMRWSLARSLFQLQRLPEIRSLLAEIEELLSDADGETVCTRWFARLAKLTLDLDLAETENADGYAQIKARAARKLASREIAFPDKDLQGIRRLARDVRSPAEVPCVADLLTGRADEMVSLWSRGKDASTLAAWSDLLCRYAEAGAFQAESLQRTLDAAPAFIDSFVAYLVAEKLRRAAFDVDPLGKAYVVNSRSTRILVRVALQLVKAHHEDAAAARNSGTALKLGHYPQTDFLMRQAQRHIDIATRYFAGLPSELPNLLIMQSQFERAPRRERVRELRAALAMIDEADSMMWAARDRQRLRMRVLLERCKVLRDLAGAERAAGGNGPSKLLALAEQDSLRLKDLSERHGIPIWQHLSRLALKKMEASTRSDASSRQRNGVAVPRKARGGKPQST